MYKLLAREVVHFLCTLPVITDYPALRCFTCNITTMLTMYFVPLSVPQQIMREKWINIGMEEDELKPYVESSQDVLDPVRIGNKKQTKKNL